MEKLAHLNLCEGTQVQGYGGKLMKVEQCKRMKELNSDLSNFSTNASQKMSQDKKLLRKAKRILKLKELTPVNDIENDSSSFNDQDDSKTCGSANVYFELGAMAAIEMPEHLLQSD